MTGGDDVEVTGEDDEDAYDDIDDGRNFEAMMMVIMISVFYMSVYHCDDSMYHGIPVNGVDDHNNCGGALLLKLDDPLT